MAVDTAGGVADSEVNGDPSMKGSEVENPFAQLRSAAFICFIVVFDSLKEPPGQQSICLRIRSASAYFFKPLLKIRIVPRGKQLFGFLREIFFSIWSH